jgi:penicillin-binding protein 1A
VSSTIPPPSRRGARQRRQPSSTPALGSLVERAIASARLSWRVRIRAWQSRRRSRPRIKWLRLLAILVAVLVLGGISFVFGMFMAVTSDLHGFEDQVQYRNAHNSVLVDDRGRLLAVLSRRNQILLAPKQIPRIVKDAVISVEDKRFYSNEGVDLRSLGRAVLHDVIGGGGVQGASTIEEQFVKNALEAQGKRTIFEKLREAALAFHLDHRWSKEKIITEYLNTIYYGNGAYGIESAARTYFGQEPEDHGCGTPQHLCVGDIKPWQAALLAGMVQSPTEYDPIEHPLAARERRNLVLEQMLAQGYIDRAIYKESIDRPLPTEQEVQPPREQLAEGVDSGYFTSWVDQQVISRYGAGLAFDGGLHVKTTLDLGLQRAAERAVSSYLESPSGPTASLVAIENSTGDVRAMVGGRNFEESPFNLATEGERQPGSSFKAFDLAAALEDGISPYSEWTSKVKTFHVPDSSEVFVVHNDEGSYTGTNTLIGATEVSDNSIFAEVGIKVGTRKIARIARQMGITTPISTNYAMTIGGLKIGVTPLDMAHAYETIAHGGQRVSGTLAGGEGLPVGIQEVSDPTHSLPNGRHREVNHTHLRQILPPGIAETETQMLEAVIQHGTGTSAAIGQFAAGKTGTTSNYVDAWFVGWDSKYTVAVWVGYPEGARPMTTDFGGQPVYGGTFPALIWKDFMLSAIGIEREEAAKGSGHGGAGATTATSTATAPSRNQAGSGTAHAHGHAGAGGESASEEATGGKEVAPTKEPSRTQAPASPAPQTPSSSGSGTSSPSPSTEAAPSAPAGGPTGGATAPTGGASAGGG